MCHTTGPTEAVDDVAAEETGSTEDSRSVTYNSILLDPRNTMRDTQRGVVSTSEGRAAADNS